MLVLAVESRFLFVFVLKENARRDRAHQERVQGLQDQIDDLRKMLKDAENQLLKVCVRNHL